MTREEEIKEAVSIDNNLNTNEAVRGFAYGVFWADAHPASLWISVKDSLPPFGVDVLCWLCKDNDGEQRYAIMRRVTEKVTMLIDDNGFRLRAIETSQGKFEDVGPKYWMPLPAPPTEKNI
ncbi:MAG: DUF551 domain-containing protein [Prevotellaceae bacterium]|nr:DUF551 domain-containing protein [Prevotellaceae bacterium]